MGRKPYEWFKVQNNLALHPKFRSLSADLKGHLLCLWCAAYSHFDRGCLPSLRELAAYLGPSFVTNTRRIIPRVLEPLTNAGFLDYDKVENKYYLHDWNRWQYHAESTATQPTLNQDSTKTQPWVDPLVEGRVDNKRLTEQLSLSDNRVQNTEVDIGSADALLPLQYLDGKGILPISPKEPKSSVVDDRYIPLKQFMEAEWMKWRGISLGSATSKKDWVQVAAMLHRTASDPAYTTTALCNAFLRWITSNRIYDKGMSVAQWATSVHVYLGSNGGIPNRNTISEKKHEIPASKDYTDKELEWWN